MTEPRQVLNFVGGQYRESLQSFELRNPADDTLAAIVFEASEADVSDAVAAAQDALNGPWANMSMEERHAMMRRVADLILERKDEFIAAEIADSGHPYTAVATMEIPRGAEQFRIFADIAAAGYEPEIVDTPMPDGRTAVNRTQRVSKGVIAAICPWNLPLIMATWKLAPALAWGNTVVLKPSEETPITATMLGEVLNTAGVPPGVVNIVNGYGPGSAGEFLTRHPDIDAINFTGETITGTAIMQSAAVGIRDISLELGGKNAAIVLDDCDIDQAIAGTTASTFYNCGQICLGTERIYVARRIADEFVAKLKASAESQVMADPLSPETTLGPLVSQIHQKKVLACYDRASKEGAEVVTGGGVPDLPAELTKGAWVEPTVWMGLEETTATVREEIFGPCCHIRAIDDEDEAIKLANDTRYGLAAVVWSRDSQRASAVAEQLNAGICWINGWMVRDLRTPVGGFGQSGIGREGGAYSMEFHTELKNICEILNDSPK